MALITLYKRDENHDSTVQEINYNGLAYEWIIENITGGENFAVYIGDVCEENDISRSDEMECATDVAIVMLPAGGLLIPIVVSIVVSVAVYLLTPIPDMPSNINRTQESPNNQLTDRRNRARLNQRVPDIIGEVRSIPDVIQNEYSIYDSDGVEIRYGAYVAGRNQVFIDDLKDGDDLVGDNEATSANIYYPFKSPNKGDLPDTTFGTAPITERVNGVYVDRNAVNQTIAAPEVVTKLISTNGTGTVLVDKVTGFGTLTDPTIDFTSGYDVGTFIEFEDLYIEPDPAGAPFVYVNLNSDGNRLEVTANAFGYLEFSISNNPEWLNVPADYVQYPALPVTIVATIGEGVLTYRTPKLVSPEDFDGETYKITSVKVSRLLFNIYAPNGLYKRNQNSGNYENVSIDYEVVYYRLDDNFNRIGGINRVTGNIIGNTFSDIGITTDIDIGSSNYIEWYIARTSFSDTTYEGSVVETIKLKSAFGLYDVGDIDFGNVTMIHTRRKGVPDSAGVTSPELNCRATESVYKYLGGGAFDTALTKNTQAMQSIISKSLDNKIGRLSVGEIDLEQMLSVQSEIEAYYSNDKAGRCCYTLDSTSISAQDTLYLIANSVSCIIWREGRVLKSWFESPQSFPGEMFTHRSKQAGSETWSRVFNQEYDGVDLKYTDEVTGKQETLSLPTNPLKAKQLEIPGIKGIELATWRANRELNKLKYQRESVEFTATAEGRFVRPSKLISVVKGTRVGSYDGEVRGQSLLTVELSQEVTFTAGDDHFIQFKNRDGSVESVSCTESAQGKRFIELDSAPAEALYFGNSELKTEFSFGAEARLESQLMLPQEIDASGKYYTSIRAVNYDVRFYQGDPIQPIKSAFTDGFDSGFY